MPYCGGNEELNLSYLFLEFKIENLVFFNVDTDCRRIPLITMAGVWRGALFISLFLLAADASDALVG